MNNNSQTNHYRPQLDTIRALAVFAVMWGHFVPEGHLFHKFYVLPFGSLGVRLFFVLSGFLISGILLDDRCKMEAGKRTRKQLLVKFYARRFLRIFPVYYAVLIGATLTFWEHISETIVWHLFYASNILFSLQGEWVPNVSHLWSLAVEEQFYLVWPFVLLIAPRKYLLGTLVSMVFVTLAWKIFWVLNEGSMYTRELQLFSCLDCLSIGSILALVQRNSYFSSIRKWIPTIGGIGFTIYVTGAFLEKSIPALVGLNNIVGYTSMALFFGWWVFGASQGMGGVLGWLHNNRLLQYVGRISYGIYLMHPFMHLIYGIICAKLHLELPVEIAIISKTLMAIAVASISFTFFESPLLRLKKYFT